MKTKKKKIRTSLSSITDFITEHNSIIKESFIALLICALGDLFAGIILGNMTFFLKAFPGLLVIIPGAIGMRGNIFGSFASRLSTNLHIGMISPKFELSEQLNSNIISAFVLTMILSLFLAILAKIFCIVFNFESISLIDFIFISIIAGAISNAIMLPITMFISFNSFKRGWDPDNVTTPIIAAIGDLFTLPAIILSVILLSYLNHNFLIKDIISVLIVICVFIALIYAIKMSDESKQIINVNHEDLYSLFSSIREYSLLSKEEELYNYLGFKRFDEDVLEYIFKKDNIVICFLGAGKIDKLYEKYKFKILI